MSLQSLFKISLGLSLLLFFGVSRLSGLQGIAASLWSDGFWTFASLGAGILCLRAARHCGTRDAVAWRLFAAACLSWFIGMLFWSWFELIEGQATPFPAISDIFFLIFAPLFGCGLWMYQPKAGSINTGYWRRSFDLGLVASASFVTITLMFYHYFKEQSELTLYFAAALAYPVLYVSVAIFGFSLAWMFVWGRKQWIFGLLLAGFVFHAVIDIVYAYALLGKAYQAGDYIDVAWLIGFALISVAAVDAVTGTQNLAPAENNPETDDSNGARAYEPVILLFTALPMLATFLWFGETLDFAAMTFVLPAITAFLVFAVAREVRGRQIESRLLLDAQTAAASHAESESRLKDVAETSYDRFWETDENFRFTSVMDRRGINVTPLPETALGLTRWELLGIDLEKNELWNSHYGDLVAHREFRDFDYSIIGENGEALYWSVSGRPFFDNDGNFSGYRGSSSNITARKRSEEKAKASEARLQEIFAIAPEAVITIGSDMKIQMFNAGAERIFGYSAKEVLGQPMELLMPEALRHGHAAHMEGFLKSSDTYRLMDTRDEITGLHKGGVEFPASASVSKIEIDGDMVYTVMLHDITERRKNEKERRAALVKAEQANEAKSAFLATMSHELRTPLNAIIGFSDMLRGQYFGALGSDKYEEYAEDIHASGIHLLSLVNDILDLSSIESGEHVLKKERHSIKDIIADSSPMIAELASRKGIDYAVEVDDENSLLYADRRALKQILLNLLSNAVKFTPKGGRITLSVATSSAHQIIRVTDTGKGISTDEIDILSTPFARGGRDAHQAQEGSGLGLAIVNSLVTLHHGALGIESEPGKGTIISVTLPIEAA